jgi:peroxiredoxin
MSKKLPVLATAPAFELLDTHGNQVSLSSYLGLQSVVLVLTRGFV